MIKKCAEKIVSLQIHKGILDEDKKSIYVFGYQLLVSKVISGILMMIIAFRIGALREMIMFMAAYIPLRQYAGGFHFENSELCILFSAILSLAIAMGVKDCFYEILIDTWSYIEIVSVTIIAILAPVDTKCKRLDEIEKKVFALRAKIVLVIEVMVFVITFYLRIQIGCAIITISHFLIMIGLVLGLSFRKDIDKINNN